MGVCLLPFGRQLLSVLDHIPRPLSIVRTGNSVDITWNQAMSVVAVVTSGIEVRYSGGGRHIGIGYQWVSDTILRVPLGSLIGYGLADTADYDGTDPNLKSWDNVVAPAFLNFPVTYP